MSESSSSSTSGPVEFTNAAISAICPNFQPMAVIPPEAPTPPATFWQFAGKLVGYGELWVFKKLGGLLIIGGVE